MTDKKKKEKQTEKYIAKEINESLEIYDEKRRTEIIRHIYYPF